MALATFEKTLLAFDPINRTVPITITRITANITAYSAMSCPLSSLQTVCKNLATDSFSLLYIAATSHTRTLEESPQLRLDNPCSVAGVNEMLVREDQPANGPFVPSSITLG